MPTYHNVPPPIPSWCCCWTSCTGQAAKHVFLVPFLDVLPSLLIIPTLHCADLQLRTGANLKVQCPFSQERHLDYLIHVSPVLFFGSIRPYESKDPKQGLTPNQKRAIFFPRRIIEGGLVTEVPIFYFHILHSWRRVADHVMPQGIHEQKHIQENNLAVDMPTGKNKALHHENGWELELLPKTEMIYI